MELSRNILEGITLAGNASDISEETFKLLLSEIFKLTSKNKNLKGEYMLCTFDYILCSNIRSANRKQIILIKTLIIHNKRKKDRDYLVNIHKLIPMLFF